MEGEIKRFFSLVKAALTLVKYILEKESVFFVFKPSLIIRFKSNIYIKNNNKNNNNNINYYYYYFYFYLYLLYLFIYLETARARYLYLLVF